MSLSEYQQNMIKHVHSEENMLTRIKNLHMILQELRYGPLSLSSQIILSLQTSDVIGRLAKTLQLKQRWDYKSLIKNYKKKYFTYDCYNKDPEFCLWGYLETGNEEGVSKILLTMINQGYEMNRKFYTYMYAHEYAFGNIDLVKKYLPIDFVLTERDIIGFLFAHIALKAVLIQNDTETMKILLDKLLVLYEKINNKIILIHFISDLLKNETLKDDYYLDISTIFFMIYMSDEYMVDVESYRISEMLYTSLEWLSVKSFEMILKNDIVNRNMSRYISILFKLTLFPDNKGEYPPHEVRRRQILIIKFLLEMWRKVYPDYDPRKYINADILDKVESFSIENNLTETYMFFLNKTIPSLYYLAMNSLPPT
jgi:hypothetical protein